MLQLTKKQQSVTMIIDTIRR